MNKCFLFLAPIFASVSLFAADSVRFTENLTDTLVTFRDPDLGSFSETRTTISAALNVSILVPGLGAAVLDPSTEFSVSLGEFSFSATAADADDGSANSITFFQFVEVEDANGHITRRRVGQMTLSRAGNQLTVAATSMANHFSLKVEREKREPLADKRN